MHAGIPPTPPPGPGRPPRADTNLPPGTRQTPPGPGRHPPGLGRAPPGPGRPPREADSSIRSTSGRYASYWNAFLFLSCTEWLFLLLNAHFPYYFSFLPIMSHRQY